MKKRDTIDSFKETVLKSKRANIVVMRVHMAYYYNSTEEVPLCPGRQKAKNRKRKPLPEKQ